MGGVYPLTLALAKEKESVGMSAQAARGSRPSPEKEGIRNQLEGLREERPVCEGGIASGQKAIIVQGKLEPVRFLEPEVGEGEYVWTQWEVLHTDDAVYTEDASPHHPQLRRAGQVFGGSPTNAEGDGSKPGRSGG